MPTWTNPHLEVSFTSPAKWKPWPLLNLVDVLSFDAIEEKWNFVRSHWSGPPWAAVPGHLLLPDGLVPSQSVVLLQPTSSWGPGVGNLEASETSSGCPTKSLASPLQTCRVSHLSSCIAAARSSAPHPIGESLTPWARFTSVLLTPVCRCCPALASSAQATGVSHLGYCSYLLTHLLVRGFCPTHISILQPHRCFIVKCRV